MSAVMNTINISGLKPSPKPIEEQVVVGKDILDLLAGSMYVDPLNVYREYIQNAADAIDQARLMNLSFEEEPGVQIFFDHAERSIRIRDNGKSIGFSEFVQRIITIGASEKRGKNLRGFRGIGRLSGLGHCQELIFRGRAEGNAKVTEIRWNGRLLKEKYRDQTYTGTLADLIKEVTTITYLSPQGFPGRFFEVEMRKVARLKNDILLNEEVVRHYLSQVAPVAFGDIPFAKEAQSKLESYGIKAPIRVELMDGKGPITHRLQAHVKLTDSLLDPITNLDFFELNGPDGEISAYGWIARHSYLGSIPKKSGLGGIRLRSGNIQVGDDNIITNFFPESRFSAWAIGEVHVLSPKILPNGRRDDFEPSAAYTHLQSELAIKARAIAQRIRESSVRRNKSRTVESKLGLVNSWLQIAGEKELPPLLKSVLTEISLERLEQVDKECKKPDALGISQEQNLKRKDDLTCLVEKIFMKPSTTPVTKLPLNVERPIVAVLRTILNTAKSAEAGVKLSTEILSAIEKEV